MTNEETEQETHSSHAEKQQNEKLLRLMTGYNQHASPFQRHTAPFLNVLIEMEKDAKSHCTIHFTYKALSLLAKNCKLEDPQTIE